MKLIAVFTHSGFTARLISRYRPLVPLFLFLALIERGLAAIAAWITKASPTGHHPPENYAVLVLVPLIVVFLVLSLRRRSALAAPS